MKLRAILDALEAVAPARYAFEFDKVGLQVGDLDQEIRRAVVSLDRSLGAVEFAKTQQAQLLLSHHPLIFVPIASVDSRSHVGRTILALASSSISFVAAHTNWDSARGGVSDALARLFGVEHASNFGSGADVQGLKLVFTCPPEHADAIVDALSEAGAGVIGAYTRCAFVGEGRGNFVCGPESNPTVGEPGGRQSVAEVRVEMSLPEGLAARAERTLRGAHPYEEPAYEFYRLRAQREQPIGRIGEVPALSLGELCSRADEVLMTRCWAWGEPSRRIRKVAFAGGAADGEWMAAQRAGADVLVTGEVKQHVALEASESGMALIAAGHFATEHPGCAALRSAMASAVPEVDWVLFTPEPGLSGRPL